MFGKGCDAMFGSGSPTTTLPFEGAARLKSEPMYDKALLAKGIAAGVLEDADPRNLRASQPSVTASGVRHYLDSSDLFADKSNTGNQHPVIYVRRGFKNIIAGHHRAAAALLKGVPLRAIVVREDVELSVSPGGRPIDYSPLAKSPRENWVEKRGGLPPYMRGVARGIANGKPVTSRNIAIAIARVKVWSVGGGNVTPAVQAAAKTAVAQWTAMKGRA